MLALERWGEGRFKPMVMLAQTVAANADACYELMQFTRSKPLLSLPDAWNINQDDWLGQYRRPRAIQGAMLQLAFSPQDVQGIAEVNVALRAVKPAIVDDLRQHLTEQLTGGRNEKLEQRNTRWLELFYRLVHLPWLAATVQGDEPIPDNFREWFAQPEFLFFFAVAMPCWLEFNATPWALYRQSVDGNLAALEKLLRLDQQITADSRISALLFRISQRSPGQFQWLMAALGEGRRSKVTLTDVRFLLGGLLMKWSAEMQKVLHGEAMIEALRTKILPRNRPAFNQWARGLRAQADRHPVPCRVNAPDIRDLFHAVASDSGRGPVDHDFCMQPNSIYKRLKRNAKLWQSLWKADKSCAA